MRLLINALMIWALIMFKFRSKLENKNKSDYN